MQPPFKKDVPLDRRMQLKDLHLSIIWRADRTEEEGCPSSADGYA